MTLLSTLGKLINSALTGILMVPIWLYQQLISRFTPAVCRFYPSCSHYAITALRVHGPVKGSWFALKRLASCHPWNDGGYDPVPGTPNLLKQDSTPQTSPDEPEGSPWTS